MLLRRCAFALTLILLASVASAKHLHPEKWCTENGGQVEVVLPDRTRWAEAIGQALYYGIQTGKKPGIVLILEKETDRKYFIRLNSVIMHYGLNVEVWEMK